MARAAAATAVVLLLVATACTPRDVAQSNCLADGVDVVVPPADTTGWPLPNGTFLPDGTTIDARGASWDGTVPNPSGFRTGMKVHYKATSRADLCMVGGHIYMQLDPELTTWLEWHSARGLIIETPGFHVVGTRFTNVGDMIVFGGLTSTDWRITGVRLDGAGALPHGYVHDDCVENDNMHEGTIEDSYLDGCHIFVSAQGGPASDGTGNTVTVTDTLVRLRPFYESYKTEKYGFDQHGGFFKWSSQPETAGIPPALVVRDSVFRADQRAYYGGNANGFLGLPPGSVCEDVTLVGWEAWPADDLASWTSQCTGLTLGSAADWDAAEAQWLADHPAL